MNTSRTPTLCLVESELSGASSNRGEPGEQATSPSPALAVHRGLFHWELRLDTLGNAPQQPTVSTDRNRSGEFPWAKISGCMATVMVRAQSTPPRDKSHRSLDRVDHYAPERRRNRQVAGLPYQPFQGDHGATLPQLRHPPDRVASVAAGSGSGSIGAGALRFCITG